MIESDRFREIINGLLEALPKCDRCKAPATWMGSNPFWSDEESEPYWCDAHLPAEYETYDLSAQTPASEFALYKFELKHAATIRKLKP